MSAKTRTADTTREDFAAYLLRVRARSLGERRLVAAIEATPRRGFIPGAHHDVAFSNRSIPIDCGETIEGLDLQTLVLEHAAIAKEDRVLEVGTGSGFTAAVMGRLAGRVLSIDRYKTLVTQAGQRLRALGVGNVAFKQADGAKGMVADGPFDKIICWVAFESVPREFIETLASGGIMICAVGEAEKAQALAKLTKVGSRFDREDIGTVRFQPVQPGIAKAL